MQKPEDPRDPKHSLLDDRPFLQRLDDIDRRLEQERKGDQPGPAAEQDAQRETAVTGPDAGAPTSEGPADRPARAAATIPVADGDPAALSRPADQTGERQRDGTLTYEPYFGLREKPFSLASDPRFFYSSEAHRRAFDTLLAAVRRREGIVVLTGEVGTGKTTLCRTVAGQLDRKTFTAFIQDPFLSIEGLLKRLLIDFGVVTAPDVTSGRIAHASRHDLSLALQEFLRSLVELQAYAVVIVDEAQNLSPQLLEELRILSDLDGPGRLLQVVLVGQSTLLERLRSEELRALDQRVTVRCALTPLQAGELPAYVGHRLAVAGGSITFTAGATGALYRASAGVPRVVNLICDRALLLAARSGEAAIGGGLIAEAAEALGFGVPGRRVRRLRPGRSLGVAAALLLLAAGVAGGSLWWQPAPVRRWVTDWLAVPVPAAPPPLRLPAGATPLPLPAAPVAPAGPVAGDTGGYAIQVGTFRDGARATDAVSALVAQHFRAYRVTVDLGERGRWQEVLVGRYTDRAAAARDLRRLQAAGGYRDARVVRLTGD